MKSIRAFDTADIVHHTLGSLARILPSHTALPKETKMLDYVYMQTKASSTANGSTGFPNEPLSAQHKSTNVTKVQSGDVAASVPPSQSAKCRRRRDTLGRCKMSPDTTLLALLLDALLQLINTYFSIISLFDNRSYFHIFALPYS